MKIVKQGKVLTSESLNAEVILTNKNIQTAETIRQLEFQKWINASALTSVVSGSNVTVNLTEGAQGKVFSFGFPQFNSEGGSTEYLSLSSFNAVGDGITDNTIALNSALSACYLAGKSLYINKGTFRFTSRLNIIHPIYMIGASHDESVLFFDGGIPHAETPYDDIYWEHSAAGMSFQCNNCKLENFTYIGGTKQTPSSHHGIIYHFPKLDKSNYSSAERITITNCDIKYFKSGEYRYAGWNRVNTCNHYIDNAECGIQYYPIEKATVGNWSGSGDLFFSNQFVGNGLAGVSAEGLHQTSFFNNIFEYNGKAIDLIRCHGVTFYNSWNEANFSNISVVGSVRFQGGYNIQPSTVNHTPESSGDIVVFDMEAQTIIYSGDTIVFNQQGGVITKGVELAVEIDNMFSNSEFLTVSGTSTVPSMIGWNVYGSITANNTTKFMSSNTAEFLCEGRTTDAYFGFRQDVVVEVGKIYTINVMVMTPDKSGIDSSGLCCYVAHKNSSGEVTSNENTFLNLISDNVWEEKTIQVTPTGDDKTLLVGFGCYRNGHVYFANPSFVYNDAINTNNVFVRKNSETSVSIVDMSGVNLGTITVDNDRNNITDSSIASHDTSNLSHEDLRTRIISLENELNNIKTTLATITG